MCGAQTSKVENTEYPQILEAVRTFCENYHMETLDASIKHFQNNSKWIVNLKSTKDDRIYRLELMVHDTKSCSKILAKGIQGEHLMAYSVISEMNGVLCFLYNSVGDIHDFIINQNLNTVTRREEGLRDILADVMVGLSELNKAGFVHLQLTWRNVDVTRDEDDPEVYHGKVGGLENLVMKRNKLIWRDIAPLKHCPPEAIRWGPFTSVIACKAQVYVMGSMMLELLVNKYMSGDQFKKPKSNMSPGAAHNNIFVNSTHLAATLGATNLSGKFREILLRMLELQPSKRCCLEDVANMLQN